MERNRLPAGPENTIPRFAHAGKSGSFEHVKNWKSRTPPPNSPRMCSGLAPKKAPQPVPRDRPA